jgi:hypothetical protein
MVISDKLLLMERSVYPLASDMLMARKRRLAAMRLQEVEGNPLDTDHVAMFEMFEREAWTHDQRRAYIMSQARLAVAAE